MNLVAHIPENWVALRPSRIYSSNTSAPWLYARSPIPSVCRTPGAIFLPKICQTSGVGNARA